MSIRIANTERGLPRLRFNFSAIAHNPLTARGLHQQRSALVQFAEQFKADEAMIDATQKTFRVLADWLDAEHSASSEPALQDG